MLLEIAIGLEIIEDSGHELGPVGAATDLTTIAGKIMKRFALNRNTPCQCCFFSFYNKYPEHLSFVYLFAKNSVNGMVAESRWSA